MSVDLSGRTALVTGAAIRLGRHLAETLAARGAETFVHCNRSVAEAEEVVAGIRSGGGRAHVLQADLLDPAAPERIAARLGETTGRLDVLVHNVGNYPTGPMEDHGVEVWRETFETNLFAPWAITRAALDLFPKGEGHVVSIGYAGVDLLRPNVGATAYQASKTALLVLTKSLAERFGPRGLRANMISPGQLENSVDLPAAEDIPRRIPLGRAGRLEDVARALLFLLEPDSYVTGVNIDVAGGYRPPTS